MGMQPFLCYNLSMSFFTSLIILLLLALIQVLLQLTPGVFAIFYHQTIGKKSRKTADNLSLYFVLGTEFFTTITFLFVYLTIFILFFYQTTFITNFLTWFLAGIFLVEGIVILFGYYRRGQGSQLFIKRRTAQSLSIRAESVKTRLDAFVLGFITSGTEIIFTLPLYIVLAAGTMQLTNFPRYPIVISYIIIAVLPIFVTRTLFRVGHNLANIQRFRTRNKTFFRVAISLCYIIIAGILIFVGAGI